MMALNSILIVEDSAFVNNALRDLFEKKGYTCYQSFTLEEALNFFETAQTADYIILDMNLPDGQHEALVIAIQRVTKAKIFVLTSENDRQVREMMFRFGVVDYFIKDDSFQINVEAIDTLMKQLPKNSEHTILCVDDSSLIQRHVAMTLSSHNYVIVPAKTAQEAQDILANQTISLILLDMELPDMHGSKLLKLIKLKMQHKDIPIIVLSGTLSPDKVREVIKSGANDYIEKPFMHEAFILKVTRLIQEFEKNQQLALFNKDLQEKIDNALESTRSKQVKMLQQTKMAQMGEMLGMIAHQWRQPLASITAVTANLTFKNELNTLRSDEISTSIEKINQYTQYLSETINDFRSFFKMDKELRLTYFEPLVNNALMMIKPLFLEHEIKIDFEVKSDMQFYTYNNELVQVLLNLMKNSYDAFMSTKTKNPLIKLRVMLQGNSIVFELCDNAGGIDSSKLDEVFEPYYTTKQKSDGTGLGLYMSKTIVSEHCDGSIDVKNKNEGVCFTITLPIEREIDAIDTDC